MKTERKLRNEKKKLMHSFILENRQWFILLGAIFLFLILLVVIVWYSGTQKNWKPGMETYRYVMGVKVPYSQDMKLTHTEAGTVIEDKDAVYSDGTPIVNEEDAQEQLMHKDLLNMTTRKVVSALQYRKEIRG